ncbi:hypothetical protein P872_13655 [Rhodonellum psychrophilum GCM71 = DSM 17998]|uniref:Uncharacterized protein n=1 Tax=Rhodonellum psychrophilum GCM71 = DSM 17998 TaxID=1123057 RepID=U5BUY1_9BACT|nr:hypothetical protein P872_13655 [Rhodonellum psychrophilum GCM71 = DSM 17998]
MIIFSSFKKIGFQDGLFALLGASTDNTLVDTHMDI